MAGVGIGFSSKVTLVGPLFDRGPERFRDAVRDVTQDLVERAESMVKAQLYTGHGLISGHLRRSIAGEMKGPLSGVVATKVVYGAWIEGVSTRNEKTRFKGYAMFRKSAQALDKMAPRLLSVRLQKEGLLDRVV